MQPHILAYPTMRSASFDDRATGRSDSASGGGASVASADSVDAGGQGFRLRELTVIWLLGGLGISAGSLLWHMDVEGLWIVRGVSLAAVLGGLFFWAMLLHNLWLKTSHPVQAAPAAEAFWFYSGGATHLEPVVEILKQLHAEVQDRATLLLAAEAGQWGFKAGYQCSPGLGRAVAHALHHRVSREGQTACQIDVLDASVIAFCTPLITGEGREFLLVSLFEPASQACHGAMARVVQRYAARIAAELGRVESPFHHQPARSSGPTPSPTSSVQAQAPVCCSVCDQLRVIDERGQERWVAWNEWLFRQQHTCLSHTICPACAGWLYDIALPPPRQAEHLGAF